MDVSHLAQCPEVAPTLCRDEAVDLPPHVHDLTIGWKRVDAQWSIGLGDGWQVGGSLPFDVRDVGVVYSLPDGSPYAPPYEDTHHRDERLAGPVDGVVVARWYTRRERWAIGLEGGVTLPLGDTVENPWRLTALGQAHQHQQLGTGTWNPVVGAEAATVGGRGGFLASTQVRLPFATNDEGYRAARTWTLSGGPTWRAHPRALLTSAVEVTWNGPEQWEALDHGGRSLVAGSGGVLVNAGTHLTVSAQGRVPVWQRLYEPEAAVSSEEGSFTERPLVSMGVTWSWSPAP